MRSSGASADLVVQIDNRIRYGLARALELGILKKGDTIVAIQGWRSGGGSTNTVRTRMYSFLVPELALTALSAHRCVSSPSRPRTTTLPSPRSTRFLPAPHSFLPLSMRFSSSPLPVCDILSTPPACLPPFVLWMKARPVCNRRSKQNRVRVLENACQESV